MADDRNDQITHRVKKLATIRAMGLDPYGQAFQSSHTTKAVTEKYASKDVKIPESESAYYRLAGRIVFFRRFGKAAFAHLQDETGRIQVYFKKEVMGDALFSLFELLDMGDLIGIGGYIFRTKTGELTIQIKELTLLAKSLRPLPEKWHGLTNVEIRYRQRYLDLITHPEVHQVFKIRAKLTQATRSFLDQEGFLEVETPMMHPIPGGAAARPFVTHHNTLNTDLYLRIAPELYLKRLMVGGLQKVYEINRNFRNEGISTVHNPEFTMLEFYIAYADYQTLMDLTEKLISFVGHCVLGQSSFSYQEHKINLAPPWKRIKFTESIITANHLDPGDVQDPKKLKPIAQKLGISVKQGQSVGKILQEIFDKTVQPALIQPTFVVDYPTDISPLAKHKAAEPSLTDRFELFISGLEVANGFSELNDPQEQRRRFEEQVRIRAAGDPEAHLMDEDFLRALEHGMPPTAGEGIGIDRLTMLLTNQTSIREVILFPVLRPEGRSL